MSKSPSMKPAAQEQGGSTWDRVERRKDTWTRLTKEYYPKIGFKYRGWKGEELTFFGLVYAEDDLYYGMLNKKGKVTLASCVGSLDGEHGWYKQIPNGGRCGLCNCVYPISGPEKCDRYRCPQGPNPLTPQELGLSEAVPAERAQTKAGDK